MLFRSVSQSRYVEWDSPSTSGVQTQLGPSVAFFNGLVQTVDLPLKIAAVTKEVLKRWIETTPTRSLQSHQCVVCYEQSTMLYTCANSETLGDNQHFVCVECYNTFRRLHRRVTCPVCRSEAMTPYTTRETLVEVGLITQALKIGLRAVEWVYEKLEILFNYRRSTPMTFVVDYLVAVAYYGFGGEVYTQKYLQGQLVSQIMMRVSTQMENDEESDDWNTPSVVQSRVAPVPTSDIFTPQIVDERLEAAIAETPDLDVPCVHQNYVSGAYQAVFQNGEFVAIDQITRQTVRLPVKPCGLQCVWKDLLRYETFCQNYIRLNDVDVRRTLIDYVNNPTRETDRIVTGKQIGRAHV